MLRLAETGNGDKTSDLTLPVRAHSRALFIDCDAKDGTTYRAPELVTIHDLWELVRLFTIQGLIAWLVPARFWRHVARVLGALEVVLHPKRTTKNVRFLATILHGEDGFPSAIEIERGFYAGRYEERFQYLRAHRPGGWEPEIRVHGRQYVDKALAKGQGIIFWGGSFAFTDLIAKMALHRLGLNVSHYSRPVHGLSHTRFGIRFINPIRTSIECQYLDKRICAELNVKYAMEILRLEAERGGALSIKVGNRGRRHLGVPFLNGRLVLATGPSALARRWGAVLLPTFTLRASDGSFDVTIGEALESNDSDSELYSETVIRRYCIQLAPFLKVDPLQWRGWRLMTLRESEDARVHSLVLKS